MAEVNRFVRERDGKCPGALQLARLQAGLLSEEQTARSLEHLADCAECAAELRLIGGYHEGQAEGQAEGRAVARADARAEGANESAEAAAIASLRSATPKGRRELAKAIAACGRRFPLMRLGAGIAAALVLGAGFYVYQTHEETVARKMVADAYSKRRTTPFRLASGGNAGRVEQESGSAEEPEELLQARVEIEKSLALRPANAALLTSLGEARLLRKDFGRATEALESARREKPGSTAAMMDLATVYAERARQTEADRPLRLEALKLLDSCITKEPANSAARFNRALLLMDMERSAEAGGELRESLRYETDGAWRVEIAERLAGMGGGGRF